MKLISVLIFLFITFSARAEFSTEEVTTKSVSDLMYMPDVGTWFVQTTVQNPTSESTVTYQGSNLYSDTTDSFEGSLEVGKVLEGNMMASIEVPYQIKAEDTTKYGPASTKNGQSETEKSKGLGDVDLRFKWRIFDQKKKGSDIDIKISVSPKTGSAESASTTKEGNNFRGGTNYSFGGEVGKKFKSIQISGGADLDFTGKSSTKLLSDNTMTDVTSYKSLSLYATVQLQPNEKFFINAGVYHIGGSDFSATNDGTTTKYDVDSYIQFGLAIGYKVSNSIAARALYTDASAETTITQGTNTFEREVEISNLAAVIQFQF